MHKKICLLIAFLLLCTSCSSNQQDKVKEAMESYPKSPAVTENQILYPKELGKDVLKTKIAIIDYTQCNDGYIYVHAQFKDNKKVEIQIAKGETKYNYDLHKDEATALPLQMGSGNYLVKVLQHMEQNQYAIVDVIEFHADIKETTSPFRYPNQIAWYEKGDDIISFALDTVKDADNDLKRIHDIYNKVAQTITYDDAKAKQASNKYMIPNLKDVLKRKRGICFDYAALMTAMLRINHIPARLICGNTDIEYHAWVEVYVEGQGWVNPDIYVDEETWTRIDPTFAAQKFQYDGSYDAVYYY